MKNYFGAFRSARLTESDGDSSAAYSPLLALKSLTWIAAGLAFLSLTPAPPPFSATNSTPSLCGIRRDYPGEEKAGQS